MNRLLLWLNVHPGSGHPPETSSRQPGATPCSWDCKVTFLSAQLPAGRSSSGCSPELSSEGDASLQTSVDPLETSKVPIPATPVTQLGLRPTEPHLLMDYGSSVISVLGNCVSVDSLDFFLFFF